MDKAIKVVLFIFMGALIVLVVTHATGFATATSAVGGQITNDAYLLSGGGKASGATAPTSYSKTG